MHTITVTLEPQGLTLEFTGIKSVVALLNKLEKKRTRVLVIRNEPQGPRLLTPDVMLRHGDHIVVRDVSSLG